MQNSSSAIVEQLKNMALLGEVDIDLFDYNCFGVALPTTGASASVTISADSDFLLWYINGAVFQPAGTNIAKPDILVNIQDDGSGRYFTTSAAHWITLVGTAENPFILPEPKLATAKSTITITLTNNSGGQYARVDMSLIGVKLFYSARFTRDDLAIMAGAR